MMREDFLRSDTPQRYKWNGRGEQLSLRSPPGFVLKLPHFHFLSVFRLGVQGDEGRQICHLGVPHLSFSGSVLALAPSRSYLFPSPGFSFL